MNAAQEWMDLATFFFVTAFAILAYAGPLRAARVAKWRQELFAVRNDLWDDMRAAGSLDTPAHRKLRDLINYFIRYAPVMNLLYLGVVIALAPRKPDDGEPSLSELMKVVRNPRAEAALHRAMARIAELFVNQLFFTTFPGALIGWPALAVLRGFRTVK